VGSARLVIATGDAEVVKCVSELLLEGRELDCFERDRKQRVPDVKGPWTSRAISPR
jgi:hypothetical protein